MPRGERNNVSDADSIYCLRQFDMLSSTARYVALQPDMHLTVQDYITGGKLMNNMNDSFWLVKTADKKANVNGAAYLDMVLCNQKVEKILSSPGYTFIHMS